MTSHEQQPTGNDPELQRKLEAISDASDKLRAVHEKELTKAERSHGEQAQVEQLQNKVEKHAPLAQELSHSEKESSHKNHPVLVNKQLKETAYTRTLTRVQKRLSMSSRLFSKVVHSKALDKPSEVVGSTVARPSGMLGGALVAFIGSSLLLWITRSYGYEYNYLAVILLFVIGMGAGLLAEAGLKSYRKSKH
jgi:hypothetical protein